MAGSWLLSLAVALCSLSSAVSAQDAPPSRFSGFSSDYYVRQSRADPEQVVPLVIGLLPGDFNALEREFYSVSDPTYVPQLLQGDVSAGREV
jgi:hypothetical protein